ncbi:hypothetical protein ACFLWS_04040 [Chloroflexota bacterium]
MDKKIGKLLSQLIEIEEETKDLHRETSIISTKMLSMIDEHELEKKRLLREKPGNLDYLIDRHDQGIRKCEDGRRDLEQAKSSIKGMLEEITIAKKEARNPDTGTSELLAHIDRLTVEFEQTSRHIELYRELFRINQ